VAASPQDSCWEDLQGSFWSLYSTQPLQWSVVNILIAGFQVLMYAGQHRLGLLLQEVHQQDDKGVGWQGALCLPVHSHHTSPVPVCHPHTGVQGPWSFSRLLGWWLFIDSSHVRPVTTERGALDALYQQGVN
jgi:hypothetical protein